MIKHDKTASLVGLSPQTHFAKCCCQRWVWRCAVLHTDVSKILISVRYVRDLEKFRIFETSVMYIGLRYKNSKQRMILQSATLLFCKQRHLTHGVCFCVCLCVCVVVCKRTYAGSATCKPCQNANTLITVTLAWWTRRVLCIYMHTMQKYLGTFYVIAVWSIKHLKLYCTVSTLGAYLLRAQQSRRILTWSLSVCSGQWHWRSAENEGVSLTPCDISWGVTDFVTASRECIGRYQTRHRLYLLCYIQLCVKRNDTVVATVMETPSTDYCALYVNVAIRNTHVRTDMPIRCFTLLCCCETTVFQWIFHQVIHLNFNLEIKKNVRNFIYKNKVSMKKIMVKK